MTAAVQNPQSIAQYVNSFNPFTTKAEPIQQLSQELPKLKGGSFEFASFEQNSQGLKLKKAGLNILIDPWFIGDIKFFDVEFIAKLSKAVFKPSRQEIDAIFKQTDLIILSQDYDDHCHMPTLKEMPKNIPVVANEKAARRIRPLGFKNITVVDFDETVHLFDEKISITGTEGSLTEAPPPLGKRQNGYVIREKDGVSIYYEPHCDRFWPGIAKYAPVDCVITQAVTTSILGYTLIGGGTYLAPTIKALKAHKFVPIVNTIDVEYLAVLFKSPYFTKGKEDEADQMLRSQGVNVHVQMPSVGHYEAVNV